MKSPPAVLISHGGPASYDRIGFDWLAQALGQPRLSGDSAPVSWFQRLGLSYWENNIAKGDASKDKLNAISPARHAGNFQAPVLLIHGEKDKTVPISQSKTMFKQLKRAKKTVELLKLEEENHNLLQGETRLQAVEAVVRFVDRHLE